MGFFLVLRAELTRSFIMVRRYWFATLTGLIIGYGMLMMLISAFVAGRGEVLERFSAQAIGGTLGFLIGMLAFGIVGMFSQGLQSMARSGELEQLCMSPHGLITNFLARSLVSAISSVLSMSIMLWLVARTVKGELHADFGPTALMLALTYVNLIGFGFMIGGLVLIFKQTGQVATIVRLVLVGVAIKAQPGMSEYPLINAIAHMVPITDAAICLKLVVVHGEGFAVLHTPYFAFLIVNCVLWTSIGVSLFKFMENWSRSKGTLGAY